ncbi:pentatricopeptide repeat-containing protein At3g18110, chloroplastic-like [Triticum dicoccoides]|uniref:pentatricopeptide repeat-containing protein At3g18110, chloroplastic-like n=1 Tax=Triticum dicoccoides TaxID=85692 RepID=UPI00162F02E0|nr:pentatricopeptide repeat-containing protein At3g18110, chloroplastic-like [Triticum dicoccoides]
MPLMAISSPLPFSFPLPSAHHPRRATAGATAAPSATASDDFDYPLADPSVRWPSLRFPHLPAPRFPAADAAPPAPARPEPAKDDSTAPSASGPSAVAVAVEPLDARAHRGRLKKLSKVALRRARDWRERVSDLADRLLALPPGAPVAEVLDGAWVSPDELAYVVRAVGAASWRRALDAFEWLAASGDGSPGPRVVAVVLGVLGRARQDGLAEEVFLRFVGEGATVQVFNAMMGVYARSGRFDDVRQLLDAMRGQGIEPDLVSFNTLINASAKSGCLAPGAAFDLLHEVRQAGLRPDVITYNTLISACSQGSILDDAVAVFKEMIDSECRPDLWTYNAMVSVHGRCGTAREAEQMFMELLDKGFKPDAVTYNSLLHAFAKEGDVDAVERVCEELVKAGFRKDGITYNTMIHMYGKMGRLDLALGLYDEMRAIGCTPDAVTYTVLIDSLGKVDRISDAGKVLEEMVDAGLKPTLVTFSALICAYAKGGRRDEAEQTFDRMVASGVKPDRLAYLVMLDIIARSGETKKLMLLYQTMMKDGYMPDDTLYQVMLVALAKGNKHEEIEGVVQDMEVVCQMDRQLVYSVLIKAGCISQGAKLLKKACLQGHEPDSKSLLSILDDYETMGKHEEGLSLLQCIRENVPSSHNLISECSIMLMCKNQKIAAALQEYSSMQTLKCGSFGQDRNLYECLITCLEEAEFLPEASQVFCDMQFIGIEPSQKIYESMISTYCKLGFPETARQLMDEAVQSGVWLNTLSSRVTIIKAYGKTKLWQHAENFVKGLNQEAGVDRRIWNALIHAYAESGLYEQARAVFDVMIKKGPLPTVDSINGMMRALITDGRLDELFVVVQELQDMGFKISKSTVILMLEAFAKAGDVFEVMKIYNGMKEAGYLPNMHIYRSMISLLCRNKRFRDVELMVAEMEAAGFKPDLVILNTLLLMYTGNRDFDKTVKVYHSILEAGLEPDEDTYNTLIVMYSRNLRPEEGFTLLNEMGKRGLTPRLESYKSLLVASGKAKLWEQGEQLFEEIRSKGYRLNRSLYHVMMKMYRDACNHSKAEQLLAAMKEDGIEPTIATMHILMTSYGTAGHPVEAEKVLNSLKSSSLEVSSLPYSTVFDAYLKNGDYNLAITKLLEMKRDGIKPDHQVWTCFIRAASLCERTDDAVLLLNSLQDCGFDLPIRLVTERTPSLLTEVDSFLQELETLEDSAALNFVNALEDLLWAFERRATATYIFQLAVNRSIYRHSIFRVIEKDWGADFRKLSAGAALVALTLWLDQMQDASLQGSPESPKSIVLVTGEGEYNMVSLRKTIRAYLLEMGSPFLPCRARTGRFVAKFYSLKMWLKDSPFCMDLELKDAPALPKMNSMKLTEGYFMRAGLVSTFKDIHEQLGEVRPKKFSRLAMLSEESRAKFIKADIKGRKHKLERMKEKGLVIPRKSKKGPRRAKFVREQSTQEVLK